VPLHQTIILSHLRFAFYLCEQDNIYRKQIFKILSNTKNLTQTISPYIKKESTETLKFCNEPFELIATEFKMLDVLNKMNSYDYATQFVIEKNLSEIFLQM